MFDRINSIDYCKMYTKIILKNNDYKLGERLFKPIFEMFEQKIKNTNLIFKYWPTKLINYLKSKNISSKEIFKAFSIDNL